MCASARSTRSSTCCAAGLRTPGPTPSSGAALGPASCLWYCHRPRTSSSAWRRHASRCKALSLSPKLCRWPPLVFAAATSTLCMNPLIRFQLNRDLKSMGKSNPNPARLPARVTTLPAPQAPAAPARLPVAGRGRHEDAGLQRLAAVGHHVCGAGDRRDRARTGVCGVLTEGACVH